MNIAHITTDYLPIRGGAELYLHYLLKVFASKGHKQKVFQIDTGVKAPYVKGLSRFPGSLGQRRSIAVWYYHISLLKEYAEIKNSDALIIHYPFYYLPVMWHPKTVILSHCVEWEQPPQKITHKIRKFLALNAYKKSTAVVSNDTNYLREMGVNIQPATNCFEEVEPLRWFIPNCVDIDRFKNIEPAETLKGKQIILVPRNSSWAKGVHLAIEAFAKFHKEHPKTIMMIVGNFPSPDYYNLLLSIIRRENLTKYIFFTGNIYWEEMPSYYAAAQMTLVPTIYSEGTSLAALESMASGCLTITTKVGGLNDLPALKSDSTADSLANVMLEAFPKRKIIADEQKQEVIEKFNLPNWSSAWLNVINSL